MFYYLEPEVCGGLGEESELDSRTHPPIVSKLHYVFDGWLGDDIIESFPCFLISEKVRVLWDKLKLTGYGVGKVKVTKSDQFEELYPETILPTLHWLKVTGTANKSDFGISKDHRLVISQAVFDTLETICVKYADIEPLE